MCARQRRRSTRHSGVSIAAAGVADCHESAVSERAVVFVVDDDPSMRRSLESLLRSIGLDARLFSSAQEFMQAPRPDAPGCLVLDVRLPAARDCDSFLKNVFMRSIAASSSTRPGWPSS